MVNRETLFISHATPQDNEFSIWLASRLEMMGYSVWIDKDGLLGGERFWPTIQKAILKSSKILLVYSKNIVTTEGILKQGIENELEYAKSIANEHNLKDFIIPLHIDNSPYNLAIGLPNINQISFENNWAEGLKVLKRKLEKDNVLQSFDTSESVMSEWYENEYVSNCAIVSKSELYFSSWWTVDEIPDKFYMYQFSNLVQAKAVRAGNKDVPISILSNVIASFDEHLNFNISTNDLDIKIEPDFKYSFTLSDILLGFISDKFPLHRDVENHFKRLLYCVITNHIRNKGFWKHEMANKRSAYFLPRYNNLKKVQFTYPHNDKKKSKAILGKFEDIGSWHYALSLQAMLFPFVGFSLTSHIVFTSDGFKVIDDDKKQHSFRRKKGKRFFNEEWRDLQLAFVSSLKEDDKIEVRISKDGRLFKMKCWPEMFWSEMGYDDPKTQMDLDKIEDYIEIDQPNEDIDNETNS